MDPHRDCHIVLSLVASMDYSDKIPLAHVLEVVAFPFYKPQKGVDQAREGQGQSLVNLGTASHHLIDREAVSRMSGLHQMLLIS